jgi:hypothetical protein
MLLMGVIDTGIHTPQASGPKSMSNYGSSEDVPEALFMMMI